MGQGKLKDLPKLGKITVPVHLMHYDDKENPKRHFQSFCFWKAADGQSDVSNDENIEIGSIGGTMGGHVEMQRYYPKHENYKQWTSVIIDVRDIWDQIETLLESENVKVQIEGLEEIQEKYQAFKKKKKNKEEKKKKKLAEIKQMQKEAEEEEEKKQKFAEIAEALKNKSELEPEIMLKPGDEGYEGSRWDLERRFGTVHGTYMIKDTEIYEDGGWDLNESLDARDVDFYEYQEQEITPNRDKDGKIPINIGCNVLACDTRHENRKVIYTDAENTSNYKKQVILNVTSFIGVSPGAIHYYGKLEFYPPDVHPEGDSNTSTSVFDLNLLKRLAKIQLTRKLKAWELKKYPEVYDTYYEGNDYSGFYTEKDVIKRGKEVFKDLFAKEWKLKIEKY